MVSRSEFSKKLNDFASEDDKQNSEILLNALAVNFQVDGWLTPLRKKMVGLVANVLTPEWKFKTINVCLLSQLSGKSEPLFAQLQEHLRRLGLVLEEGQLAEPELNEAFTAEPEGTSADGEEDDVFGDDFDVVEEDSGERGGDWGFDLVHFKNNVVNSPFRVL